MQLPNVHSEQPSSAAEELLRQASSLPPAPLVSLKLWRLLHEEEARRGEVAELVRYDARLCGLILRLANSAMYGGRGVRSIDQAVLALGAKAVGDAVFVLIGKEFLAAPNGNYRDRVRVWRHSVTAAVAAAHLAAHTTRFRVDPGTAYTAGLLHDIGTSVIAHSGHPELPTLIAFQSEERCSWAEAEGAVLGTDHAELGGLLLQSWELPADVVRAVRLHCAPEADPSGLAAVAHLASLCAEIAVDPRTRRMLEPALTPLLVESMGFAPDVVESTLDHLGRRLAMIETLVGA